MNRVGVVPATTTERIGLGLEIDFWGLGGRELDLKLAGS